LEALLKSSEEELMALKTECSVVNKARKAAQVEIAEEMNRLETHWKRAVGRVLETEVAVEALRREIVDRQRAR
jgi:pre-mRNA-splicing factor SPF27